MTDAIKCTCTLLFLVGASTGFAQSNTTSGQKTGVPPTTTMRNANGISSTASASTAPSSTGDPDTEANIQKMERELMQADKIHDTIPFTKYLDENIIAFGPGWKAVGKAEVLQGIKYPCTVNSVAMSDFASKWVTPESVLVTYTGTEDRTCEGKTSATKEFTSSLWHKTAGTWTTIFHQATTVEPMNAAAPPQAASVPPRPPVQ